MWPSCHNYSSLLTMDAWNWRRSAAVKAFVLSLPPLKEGTGRGVVQLVHSRLRPCTVYDKQLRQYELFELWTLYCTWMIMIVSYSHFLAEISALLPQTCKGEFSWPIQSHAGEKTARWSVKQTMAFHEVFFSTFRFLLSMGFLFPPAWLWIGRENSSPLHGWGRRAQN